MHTSRVHALVDWLFAGVNKNPGRFLRFDFLTHLVTFFAHCINCAFSTMSVLRRSLGRQCMFLGNFGHLGHCIFSPRNFGRHFVRRSSFFGFLLLLIGKEKKNGNNVCMREAGKEEKIDNDFYYQIRLSRPPDGVVKPNMLIAYL